MRTDAGPALPIPAPSERKQTSAQVTGPASYHDWLRTVRKGDMVRVLNSDHLWKLPERVTDATPCYLFLGKLKFHRRHGWQVMRQAERVYRLKLRIVRSMEDA